MKIRNSAVDNENSERGFHHRQQFMEVQLKPANDNSPRLMSPKEAAAETSLSRVTLNNLAEAGMFPKPVTLGARRIAFVRAEVVQWVDERIAARASA